MPAPGRARPPRHRAQLGHSRAVAAAELLVGAVGRRSDRPVRPAARRPRSGRLGATGPVRGPRRLAGTPGRSADRPARSRSPARRPRRSAPRAFPGRAGVSPLRANAVTASNCLLGLERQRPVVPRPGLGRGEVRLGVRDDLEPGRLLGGHLGLPHPPLAFLVGPGRDHRRRGVAKQAQRVVKVAAAQVLERAADLPPRRRVEDVRRGLDVAARPPPRVAVVSIRPGISRVSRSSTSSVKPQPRRLVAEERRGRLAPAPPWRPAAGPAAAARRASAPARRPAPRPARRRRPARASGPPRRARRRAGISSR